MNEKSHLCPLGDENDKFIFGVSFFGGIVGFSIGIISDALFPTVGISGGRICHLSGHWGDWCLPGMLPHQK